MFKNKQKVMEKVESLPKGSESPSGRYWCVTCKKLFELDEPVCPYMPKVCLNSPIAVENIPPESTVGLEKFGLFYPKIPQDLLAELTNDDWDYLAEEWVNIYLEFLDDWNIQYKDQPLQTIKSFIITVSGCETAQRITEKEITFIVTDIEKVWEKSRLIPILEESVKMLKNEFGIEKEIVFDDTSILGEEPMGKYFCPMCRKFFEFSIQKDTITCPLMAQKCMATPTDIRKMNYEIKDLIYVYEVTPDIYKRMISEIPNKQGGLGILDDVLYEEWGFDADWDEIERLGEILGLVEKKE